MTCILVEDDRQTREGLEKLVPWGEIGFERVVSVENGLEALAAVRQVEPDLVISDVRMPRMNGVQLLKALREGGSDVPFLFLSGFSDKEYLMAAIRYHAVDYLEKPIMLTELTERLRSIAAERSAHVGWVSARALLDGDARRPAEFNDARCYQVALLLLAEDGLSLTEQQLDYEVRAFYTPLIAEREAPGRMLIIAAEVTEPLDFARLVRALNHAGGGYAVCVSERVAGFDMLPQAYVQAEACASRAYMGPLRGLYRYAPRQPELEALLSELPLELERIKRRRLYFALPTLLRTYVARFEALSPARNDAMELLGCVGQALEGVDSAALSGRSSFAEAIAEAYRLLDAYIDRALETEVNAAVGRAIRQIAQRLDTTLQMNELAKAAYVSASHLSYLFKRDTGVSVKQYMHEMQVEIARLLLAQGRPIREVAERVGISDVVYFSKLFKRETGVTPGEYRKWE